MFVNRGQWPRRYLFCSLGVLDPGCVAGADVGLKDKEEKPEPKPGMTADEVKVAEKAYRNASLWMFNLSVAIRDPSSKQAEMMNDGSMS